MTKIFGANLKMNPVVEGVRTMGDDSPILSVEAVLELIGGYPGYQKGKEIVVFAPDILLPGLADYDHTRAAGIRLGAQDVSEHVSGAYTAQTSPIWLNNLGITDVLVGHSEVRDVYENLTESAFDTVAAAQDIDRLFNEKIKNALRYGLRPTYCVGEQNFERETGRTNEVLEREIQTGLAELSPTDLERVIIAYEPRWAIGGDKPTPTQGEIGAVHAMIRAMVNKLGHPNVNALPILYGGSMTPQNAAEIMAVLGVDGGLIGSASLDAEKFFRIVNYKQT